MVARSAPLLRMQGVEAKKGGHETQLPICFHPPQKGTNAQASSRELAYASLRSCHRRYSRSAQTKPYKPTACIGREQGAFSHLGKEAPEMFLEALTRIIADGQIVTVAVVGHARARAAARRIIGFDLGQSGLPLVD